MLELYQKYKEEDYNDNANLNLYTISPQVLYHAKKTSIYWFRSNDLRVTTYEPGLERDVSYVKIQNRYFRPTALPLRQNADYYKLLLL